MTWSGIDDHLLAADQPFVPASLLKVQINAADDVVNRTRGAGHGFTDETGRRPTVSTPTFEWRELLFIMVPHHLGIETVNWRGRYELARGSESAGASAMYARLVVEGVAGSEETLDTTSSAEDVVLSADVPLGLRMRSRDYLRVSVQVKSIRAASSTMTVDIDEVLMGNYLLTTITAGSAPATGRAHYELQVTNAGASGGTLTELYHVFRLFTDGSAEMSAFMWPHTDESVIFTDGIKNFASAALYPVGAITLHGRGSVWTDGGFTKMSGLGLRGASPGDPVAMATRNNMLRLILRERGRWWGHGPRGDLGAASYIYGYQMESGDSGDDRIIDAWRVERRDNATGVRVAVALGVPLGRDVEVSLRVRVYEMDGTLATTISRAVNPHVAGPPVLRSRDDVEGSTLAYNLIGHDMANTGAGDTAGQDEHLQWSFSTENRKQVVIYTIDYPWGADFSDGDDARVVLDCPDGYPYVRATGCWEVLS